MDKEVSAEEIIVLNHFPPRVPDMKTRRLFLLILPLLLASCGRTIRPTENDEQTVREIRYEYGIPVDSFRIVTHTVQNGETLGGILARLGASKETITGLLALPRDTFDMRSLRPEREYLAFYGSDSTLEYFVYKQSRIHSVVFHLKDSLHVERQQKEIRNERRMTDVTIESSLWNAFAGAGIAPSLALELSEIYQWTVDFFGLQRGDRFCAIYDEQYVDSTSIGIGRIYAAAYTHQGKTLRAYWFEEGETRGYFDENGCSLRKAFLKAPLNYKRISSSFTYARKHPIYKTVRPHTGVDYAAPMGTPVVALGDGTVTERGYKGGGGNTVKIRHNSTYTTAYLHLSRYGKDIAVGKRVSQGQVIGYVGSTGASTGPHLDFRVWKNGTPVNPLTLESPSVDPVPQSLKASFDSLVVTYGREWQL